MIPPGEEGGAGGGQGDVLIAIAAPGKPTQTRQARIVGGKDRVRAGGVEMGLDCLRRSLQGLAIDDKVDFERQ